MVEGLGPANQLGTAALRGSPAVQPLLAGEWEENPSSVFGLADQYTRPRSLVKLGQLGDRDEHMPYFIIGMNEEAQLHTVTGALNLQLYLAGKLRIDELITHRYGLDDANEAFRPCRRRARPRPDRLLDRWPMRTQRPIVRALRAGQRRAGAEQGGASPLDDCGAVGAAPL